MRPSSRVKLVSINYKNVTDPQRGITPADAVVTADIAPEIAQLTGAVGTTAINSIIACDFLPSNDNLLYFAVSVNVIRPNALGTGGPASVPIVFLMTYDFSQPTVQQAVQLAGNGAPGTSSEFVSDPPNAGDGDVAPTVSGFSFTSNDRLVAFVTGKQVGGRGDAIGIGTATGLIEVDPNNPIFDLNDITPVTENGAAITDFHSLEVVPGDDDFVFGITGTGAATTLLHVDRLTRPNALATNFGPLLDPSDLRAVPRGFNLGDLTWNPQVPNPATGKKGALIVEDTVTDELLVVDGRDRFPATDIMEVYATNTTSASSFSLAQVNISVIGRPEEPYTGAVTDIGRTDVTNAQTGANIPGIVADDGTGRTFIGARIIQTGTPVQLFGPRRIKKTPSQKFGALPVTTKYVYAGIVINGDINNFLVGGMVMGNVRVFGSANLFYAGEWLTGDARGVSITDSGGDIEGNFYGRWRI